MKMLKFGTKTVLAVFFIVGLIAGCDRGNPVPEKAFIVCHESGGTPVYSSDRNGTNFICAPKNASIEYGGN